MSAKSRQRERERNAAPLKKVPAGILEKLAADRAAREERANRRAPRGSLQQRLNTALLGAAVLPAVLRD